MLISVILPVHNAQPFLSAALQSIAAQTCTDFECLIIDDGSTDASPALADQFAADDARFRVVHRPNRGLVAALNEGIALAGGAYLARMDADDVSLSQRLARQIEFLEANPDLAGCGTFAQTIGEEPSRLIKHPTDPDFVRASLIFRCPLIHPTVMMRRAINPIYDAAFKHCEDYALWAHLGPTHRFANLAEPLLQYRIHSGQISVEHRAVQEAAIDSIWGYLLQQLGLQATNQQRQMHRDLALNRLQSDLQFVRQAEAWLNTLLQANDGRHIFPERAFAITLARRWKAVCNAAGILPGVADVLRASALFPFLNPDT
jgi:glycosyltransferase involved in cell wall biosynthesis